MQSNSSVINSRLCQAFTNDINRANAFDALCHPSATTFQCHEIVNACMIEWGFFLSLSIPFAHLTATFNFVLANYPVYVYSSLTLMREKRNGNQQEQKKAHHTTTHSASNLHNFSINEIRNSFHKYESNETKWNEMNGKRHSTRKFKINKYNSFRSVPFRSFSVVIVIVLAIAVICSLSLTLSVSRCEFFCCPICNAQCAYLNVSTHFLMGNHYDKATMEMNSAR